MLVREWMSTDLITVELATPIHEAVRLMRDHKIRCLPVLDQANRVVGIISDRDLKAASPSIATTMDVHEVHYLFRELKARDIMTAEVITITPDDTVEKAAVIMHDRQISSLPVVEDGAAVGIITLVDVSRVLTSISGIYRGGAQIALTLKDRPEAVGQLTEVVERHGGALLSVLCLRDMGRDGFFDVYLRAVNLPPGGLDALSRELGRKFTLNYVARNELADLQSM